MRHYILALVLVMALLGLAGLSVLTGLTNNAFAADEKFRMSTNKEVREVMPETPVKVKFKKLADGSYTWEITGTDVRQIIEADKALRKYISQSNLKAR